LGDFDLSTLNVDDDLLFMDAATSSTFTVSSMALPLLNPWQPRSVAVRQTDTSF